MLEYDEMIETFGVRVPFCPDIITPKIERPMRNNRYEGGEVNSMRDILQPGDRVLEIGAGVGLVATVASKCPDVASVTTVEANPGLIPLIEETFRINDVQNVTLKNAVVSASDADAVDFYLRADFWASSMEPDSRAYVERARVPNIHIKDLMNDVDPTVISCDIEGAELGLFDEVDLANVRYAVLELHPKVYGAVGVRNIVDVMASKGFRLSPDNKVGGTVKLFERISPATAKPAEQVMPVRSFAAWPPANPNILIVTCMKDEGPFILEWIAWHQAAGVTDFLVFTNECTDGTDAMLDRLDALGVVTHLPNPAQATNSEYLQPIALNYAHYLKPFAEADFVISMDVDEFINVRVGKGRLQDLFEAVGDFDVLSMSELNHGSNKNLSFEPGWVKSQFPLHESESPGARKARRGVKSITRLTPRVQRIRNHRPDLTTDNGAVRWLDGSGRDLKSLLEDGSENGIDVRGSYGLVSLDHFALRSLDSYLVKMFRGDVVVKDKQVSRRYWRVRNSNERHDSTFDRLDTAARKAHDALMSDETLAELHEFACDAHAARIEKLKTDPHFLERRNWILDSAWE
ncbi:MAG: FkbM family methyltransferase [Rhodobacter sp.]|nr:FkbM family methyltransferase [Rhodobacter sp.]